MEQMRRVTHRVFISIHSISICTGRPLAIAIIHIIIHVFMLCDGWPAVFRSDGTGVHKVCRPMGEPYLMLDASDQIVFGLAFGQYLLCGAGYREEQWARTCENMKVQPNDYFWYSNTKHASYLIPSTVLAFAIPTVSSLPPMVPPVVPSAVTPKFVHSALVLVFSHSL